MSACVRPGQTKVPSAGLHGPAERGHGGPRRARSVWMDMRCSDPMPSQIMSMHIVSCGMRNYICVETAPTISCLIVMVSLRTPVYCIVLCCAVLCCEKLATFYMYMCGILLVSWSCAKPSSFLGFISICSLLQAGLDLWASAQQPASPCA